jgi:hypothetical protein
LPAAFAYRQGQWPLRTGLFAAELIEAGRRTERQGVIKAQRGFDAFAVTTLDTHTGSAVFEC